MNMGKDKYISIIIPAYNCEKYLARCLDSVLKQKYDKLEIILINDGSTDSTGDICRFYAEKDKRINFLEQENHGVAYTRKKGIQTASGFYTGFVDADDYIDENMYEEMVSCIGEAHLITSGYYYKDMKVFDAILPGLYNTEEQKRFFYKNMIVLDNTTSMGITTNLWSKLFVTEKLKRAVCDTAIDVFVGEDAEILFKYILSCDSICISEICAYHYELNSGSIVNSVNKKYLYNVNSLYLSLEKEFKKSNYKDILLPKLDEWIWQMIQSAPLFMGFDVSKLNKPIRYLNPYNNLLSGKRVILYGAGAVGKDYYKLYQKNGEVDLVLWVDKEWEFLKMNGFDVKPLECITEQKYDYVLIAIKDKIRAGKIISYLQQNGIEKDKILWKEPVKIY